MSTHFSNRVLNSCITSPFVYIFSKIKKIKITITIQITNIQCIQNLRSHNMFSVLFVLMHVININKIMFCFIAGILQDLCTSLWGCITSQIKVLT